MPEMKSLRSFRLASTTGHVVLFEANTPCYVPDALVAEAMKYGCVPVNADDIPFYEDVEAAKVEFQGDARRSTIYLAIKAIVDANNIIEFDAGGVPKREAVSKRLGFEVARDEVRAIYQMFTAARADGREFGLHPEAANIMRVIEAESKMELVALADEFGIDAAKSKGLTNSDLRKLMLTKFHGIARG